MSRELEKERRYSPCLTTDIVLWWLQLTTEMNVTPSGLDNFYQLFSFTKKQKYDFYYAEAFKGESEVWGIASPPFLYDAKGYEHWVERAELSIQLGSLSLDWLLEVRIFKRMQRFSIVPRPLIKYAVLSKTLFNIRSPSMIEISYLFLPATLHVLSGYNGIFQLKWNST